MQRLTLPKGGKTMEEGTVVEWLVAEGEPVSAGEPVVLFESEKMTSEITASEDGVLLERAVEAGETVPVGTELGRIGEESDGSTDAGTVSGEDVGTASGEGVGTRAGETGSDRPESVDAGRGPGRSGSTGVEPDPGPFRAAPSTRRLAREHGVSLSAVAAETGARRLTPAAVEAVAAGSNPPTEDGPAPDADELVVEPVPNPEGDVLGSPWARTLAANYGVSLEAVADAAGTDRVRAADVTNYVERDAGGTTEPSATAAEPAVESAVEPGSDAGGAAIERDRTEPRVAREAPITGARGVMFERMGTVAGEYASTTTVARVDVTELLALYNRLSTAWGEDVPVSLTAFVVRAVGRSLPDYETLNAEVTEAKTLRIYEDVNVGIAVDTDDGLLVPTIYDANDRTVRGLSREVGRLASGAREGTLEHDDLQNGTFTVSNAGSLGAYINTPQINPPQTAVLGTCAIVDEPGIVDGEVVPRKFMHLTLTYDHRVVEGATAVGFLQEVKSRLEAPESLLS